MGANDNSKLGWSVRELLERALKLIQQESTRGPDFDKRIDLYFDLKVYDPKLKRKHPATVRMKLTAVSTVLEKPHDDIG